MSKFHFVLILIVLLVASSQCCFGFILRPPVQRVCNSTSNPLLERLTQMNLVSKLVYPYRTYSHCGDEWRDYGSCCHIDSLGVLAKLRNVHSKMLEETIDNELRVFQKFIESLQHVTESGDSTAHIMRDRLGSQKLKLFKTELKRWLEDLPKLSSVHKNCVSKLDNIKRSSYCSICSSRSAEFFLDGKLKVNEDDCRDIISQCSEYWSSLIRLDHFDEKFNVEIELYKDLTDKQFEIPDLAESGKMLAALGITNSLKKCLGKDAHRTFKCSFNDVASICTKAAGFTQDLFIPKSEVANFKKVLSDLQETWKDVKSEDFVKNSCLCDSSLLQSDNTRNLSMAAILSSTSREDGKNQLVKEKPKEPREPQSRALIIGSASSDPFATSSTDYMSSSHSTTSTLPSSQCKTQKCMNTNQYF